MKKIVKRFDKNLNKFIKKEVEISEILEENFKVLNKIDKYKRLTFIDKKDLEIIKTMKNYIDNFNYNFFDIYKNDVNAKLFKEKLYTLDRKINKYLLVKKRKDNLLIQEAIEDFKIELRGYRSLKESINKKLQNYKIKEYKKRMNFMKTYKRRKTERVSRYGHESYGCILSIDKTRRGSF